VVVVPVQAVQVAQAAVVTVARLRKMVTQIKAAAAVESEIRELLATVVRV
jgi:hypothetical protein